jgi:hypothetical protein
MGGETPYATGKPDSVADEERELYPFLPDPYQPALAGAEPPPRTALSAMAVSSLVSALLLGPVGAILAILFGVYARRAIDRPGSRVSGRALATVGIVLGVALTPAWGGALSYIAWRRAQVEDAPPSPAVQSSPQEAKGAGGPPAAAPSPASPPAAAPSRTHVLHVGKITVVDIGKDTASLAEELARQRAEAATAHEILVLMTTAGRCEPCRGVDASLADPLMQAALAKVRLIRVDIELFHEDLDALKVPHLKVPGFFLLALDLTPRDGIHGGEWDEDIAANIAPVLGAFVRDKYTKRREAWTPLPGNGMSL